MVQQHRPLTGGVVLGVAAGRAPPCDESAGIGTEPSCILYWALLKDWQYCIECVYRSIHTVMWVTLPTLGLKHFPTGPVMSYVSCTQYSC